MTPIKTFIKTVAMTVTMVMLISCTDNFDEINTNPSVINADVMDANMFMTRVQKNSVWENFEYNHITEMAGYAENQSTTVLTDRNINQLQNWSRNYVTYLKEIIRLTEDDPLQANKTAMARIYLVYIFHQITDAYGDIPYSQVGLAIDEAVNFPEYERQEDIYEDMLNELREAADQLSDDPDLLTYGGADLLYGGDVEMWRRFANSLRLRLAIRVRFVDENLASTHIDEVIGRPLIETTEHMAFISGESTDADQIGNRNPLFNREANNPTIPVYINFTISEVLQMRDDPRLPIYFNPAPEVPVGGDIWRGRPMNVEVGDHEGDWFGRYTQEVLASMGDHFQQSEYKIKIMHAPEVYFLRAEAALAGLTGENAENMHREGVRLALEMYDVDPAEIDAYLDTDAARLNGNQEENLKEIIVQKYISNYWQSRESWAEHRRTGYPLIWAGTRGDVHAEEDRAVMRRYMYPTDEYLKNEANVNEAISRLDRGDTYRSKVWWDKKPGLPIQHPRQHTFPPDRDWND